MGIQAHKLNIRGPHARRERDELKGPDDDLDDLSHPFISKQFSKEGKNV
jgi:hypothetical protein